MFCFGVYKSNFTRFFIDESNFHPLSHAVLNTLRVISQCASNLSKYFFDKPIERPPCVSECLSYPPMESQILGTWFVSNFLET